MVQAFVSFVITQSRSFFLTNPTITVGLLSGVVISCLFGVVYSLAKEIERSEAEDHDWPESSEWETPFTDLQLTVIDQIVTDVVRRERLDQYPPQSDNSQGIESEIDELRERIAEIEWTEMPTEDPSSLESAVEENRESVRTLYATVKRNVEEFDPPHSEDESAKNQDDTVLGIDRDETGPEAGLE